MVATFFDVIIDVVWGTVLSIINIVKAVGVIPFKAFLMLPAGVREGVLWAFFFLACYLMWVLYRNRDAWRHVHV